MSAINILYVLDEFLPSTLYMLGLEYDPRLKYIDKSLKISTNCLAISFSVSVHLFLKNYKYIIYTKLNNEEETSIKAQGRWHGGHQY